MNSIKHLNHRLPVQLTATPGAYNVMLEFPGGRKNAIWFVGGYRSQKAPPIQADFPLHTLNFRERAALDALLRLHDRKTKPALPWNRESPLS